MKKNNKFRSGGNSNAYSLNYKFDSISPAGKINGTALDLIKRYNELAKEAHGSGDFVEMEIYRQYAEHYRKIVTEINERKALKAETPNIAENTAEATDNNENKSESENNADATETSVAAKDENVSTGGNTNELKVTQKKSFKIIEIHPRTRQKNTDETQTTETSSDEVKKPRRIRRLKPENLPKEDAAAI